MSGRSLTAFELDHWLLSCLQTQSETMALPGLWACWSLDWNYTICSSGSQALGLLLELNNWLSWISSLPIHPADLGACQTVYMYKPIPCNKSIHTHTHTHTHTQISYCWDRTATCSCSRTSFYIISYLLPPVLCLKYSPPILHFHALLSSLNSLVFLSPQKKPSLTQAILLSPFIPFIFILNI